MSYDWEVKILGVRVLELWETDVHGRLRSPVLMVLVSGCIRKKNEILCGKRHKVVARKAGTACKTSMKEKEEKIQNLKTLFFKL